MHTLTHQARPLVSIVVLIENESEPLLRASVNSVLAQHYAPMELLLVDLAWGDAPPAWLVQGGAVRVRWLDRTQTGLADALNQAMRQARGTLIGWLKAGDQYTADAVQRAVTALLEQRECLLVYGQAQRLGADGRNLGAHPTPLPQALQANPGDAQGVCQSSVFFRRSMWVLLGPLDTEMQTGCAGVHGMRVFERLPGRFGFVDAVQVCTLQACEPVDAVELVALADPCIEILPLSEPVYGQGISLGCFCHAAMLLRQLGWRESAGPFDWIFSSPEVTAHVLADDFKTFLDPAQFQPVALEDRVDPHSNRCHHRFYRENFGQQFMFNHHSPDQAQDLAYFQRAVQRFRHALGAQQPSLLLMVSQDPYRPQRYAPVLAALEAMGANCCLVLVNFVVRPVLDEALERVLTLTRSPRFVVFELAVSGRSDGVAFADPQDASRLAQLLRSFSVQTHARTEGPRPGLNALVAA
jgi:hypothetical protein